jgi:hypothetical protein
VSWKAAIPQPEFRVRVTREHDLANRISLFDHGVLVAPNRAQGEVGGSARAFAPPLLDQTDKKNKTRNEKQNGEEIEDHSKPPTQWEMLTGRCEFRPGYRNFPFAFSPSAAKRRMALGAVGSILREDEMDGHREADHARGKRQERSGDHGSDR